MQKNSGTTGTMGVSLATILGLNAVIGAGIFGVPAALQTLAGPAGIISYLFVIVAVLCIALAMARMSMKFPSESIFYTHTKLWAGHSGGIIATFSYVIGLTVALGLLGKIAGSYLSLYLPFLSPTPWGVILIAGLTALCFTGAKGTHVSQIILIIFTILPLVLITALCSSKADFNNLIPFAPHGAWGAFSAIKAVVFGFFGFEAIPSLFSSIKNPQRTIPRAIILTVLITGIVYLSFTTAMLLALPTALFENSSTPLSKALLVIFPTYKWLVIGIDLSIIITIAGTLHSMLLAVSSIFSATIKKITIHSPFSSIRNSLILIAFGAICCTFIFNDINTLFSLVALGITAAFAGSIVPLLLDKSESFFYRFIALAGLGGTALIAICGLVGIFVS
ncbi:MAG: hypothetical protein UV38_C0001G0202 [candidate division TM6 bacterium GW2011_GWE2_42_60]|nr:MAG: hypothetical protein UV38_C0001G0202 [candidate division TM6 bacterium GW2011_GWE2_42_60]HBY05603.1 hypothetical protein [Candidatus Dependentiae bacterium]